MSKDPLPHKSMEDSKKFEVMYRVNQPLIYRFMFWRTKDEMLAQDLTSNVFEKAWRTRHNFTGGSGKAWLYKIARTTLIDYWRKKRDLTDEAAVANAAADIAEPGEALDKSLAAAELRAAVAKLPVEMQRVVRQRFIVGSSVRETAATLDLSEANVRVIQYRALKKLRELLQ